MLQCALQRATDKVYKERGWGRYVTKTKHTKPYGVQLKQCLEGNLQMKKTCIKKGKISQIKNLGFYLQKLEREEQTKLKANTKKDIIKNRAEINESKSWFLGRINKTDKSLAWWTNRKNKRENTQITKIRNERGAITTYFPEMERILREGM